LCKTKKNNKTEQNSSWQRYFKHSGVELVHGKTKVILSRSSPGSLKSMNIHFMISPSGPVRQTDRIVRAQNYLAATCCKTSGKLYNLSVPIS